jgi:hypothetical protein
MLPLSLVLMFSGAGADTLGRVGEFVRAEMARERVPGVALAIVDRGEVVKAEGYGYANSMVRWPVSSPSPTPAALPSRGRSLRLARASTDAGPKLMRLLADPSLQRVVVEHRNRLMHFGCEYVEAALAVPGPAVGGGGLG